MWGRASFIDSVYRTAVWASCQASGEDTRGGGACLDRPSADAFGWAVDARGTEPASAAVEHVPRGERLRAHGDEQRREHGAISGRRVGRGQSGGDWCGRTAHVQE